MTVADNRGRVHGRLGRWKFEREGEASGSARRSETVEPGDRGGGVCWEELEA